MRNGIILLLLGTLAAGCSAMPNAGYESRSSRLARTAHVLEEARKGLDDAVALVAERQYDPAAEKLTGLIDDFKAADDKGGAAETTFWLAYCHEKQGHTGRAAALYNQVIHDFPGTPAARQATARMDMMR